MFDELYPEAADLALKTKINRPPAAPKAPEFSTWGMFRGLGTGLPAGAAQGIASTGEMLGAFGTTLATTGGSAGGMFALPTEAEHKQHLEATDKLIKGDELFAGGEVTRSFRNAAEGYKPDPTTTHTAEQVVFNFARVGGKAITAAMTMGNVPGAIVVGAEEGFTQAEELKQQGVDIGTRTKVGAVTAVTNAVGFALPVAGKTWLQTAGLVAVGGPGTFVTQQAATRAILENANYADLAKQYDPTDTLGLAMSVLLPGAFGALAMRGAKVKPGVDAKGPMPDGTPPPDASPAPQTVAQKFRGMTEDEYIAAITQGKAPREFNDPMPQDAFDSLPNTGESAGSFKAKDGTNIELVKGSGDYNGAIFAVTDGKTVGYMAPEAGTTGLFVSDDFRGRGIGEALSTAYRTENPMTPSGGFSAAGEAIARKVFRKLADSEMPAPKMAPPDDLVDAARVSLVRQHMDAANPMPDNVETAGAHNAAYSQALDQVAAGERVAVADVAPKVEQNLLEWGARETAKNGEFVKADYKLTDSQPIYQMREMSPADLYLPELDSSGKLQPEKRGYLPGYIERAKAGEIPPAITAIEMEDGRIRVVDGHRRAMAAKEAGNTIRVLVSPLIDTPAGKVEATAENIANNPIADWGAGLNRALEDMAAAGERVAAKAAEEIGARIDAAKQADFVEVVAKPNSDFVQAKSDAGLVGGHVRDGALHITTAEVDPAYRGQGEGIKLYTALVDDALAKGQRVFSDSTVEASAVRMYEALQRRGYEVKRLEGGSLEDGAAYGKGAKEPAFEVVGKTEPKPAPALADTAQAATKTVADQTPDLATFMTAKGLDAPAAPVEPKAANGNAFIAWLKDAGGVAWSQKTDIVGERGVRGNYAGIFTKKGQNLDTLVESAVQAGYLTRADLEASGDVGGTRALSELIRRATTGEKIATVENADASRIAQGQARAAMDAVDSMERELRALGVDPSAARGNADALGTYLAEHRTALVNKKLAEIDAETKAERIATGEAYNLSPKQIDAQTRITLAGELDENAMHQSAMVARDEVDFLNRVEEIINNAPGSRKTIQSGQGSAADASIPARDGQAAADATTSASGFNPAALAADAARFLEGGKSAAQVIGEMEVSGAKASPEMQNMLIGVAEFGGRINELADQVSALKAQRGAGTKPFELVAQAVENMRTGTKVEAPKPKTPTEARFADLQARNPDVMDKPMQFDVDENGNAAGPATTAREYLERIQREADQDTADASLIEVAANCFLSGGM